MWFYSRTLVGWLVVWIDRWKDGWVWHRRGLRAGLTTVGRRLDMSWTLFGRIMVKGCTQVECGLDVVWAQHS